jgi:uncharacterized YceG family protein
MGAPPDRGRARRRIAVRRIAALATLLAGVIVAAWGVSAALSGGDDDAAPPPTTTRAARPAQPRPLRILFPEGFTRRQMAERISAVNEIARRRRKVRPRLSARQYLAVTNRHRLPGRFARDGRARSLEGFLFPATYDFTKRTTSAQLVSRQLEAFRRTWATVDLAYARSKNLTPYDVLIIASLVERETVVPSERPLVAAVIYNRLRARMPLGIDASIRYGLNVPATEPLRNSQLHSDSPYNTRTRPGLPPTPIANPGLASMRAAAHPAHRDYLYFVRRPDKRHHYFTASKRDFDRKVCEYGYACQ